MRLRLRSLFDLCAENLDEPKVVLSFCFLKSIVQWRYLHIQYITAHSFPLSSLCGAFDAVLALSPPWRGPLPVSLCFCDDLIGVWQVLTVSGWIGGKEGAFVTKQLIGDYWKSTCQSELRLYSRWKCLVYLLQWIQPSIRRIFSSVFVL